jgi:hypothetical protein
VEVLVDRINRFPLGVRHLVLAAGLVALALLVPRPAAALEKVINGQFDYGLSNWPQIVTGGEVSWDGTLDADGSALSGSYRIENQGPAEPNATVQVVVARCYPANPGEAFFGGATVRFAENEPSTGKALVLLKSFASADCSGAQVAIAGSGALEAGYGSPGRGVWTKMPVPALVVPPGGKSISLQFFVGLGGGTSISANIDDVYLAPVGTPVCGGLPATKVGTDDPDVIAGTEQSDVIVGLGGADQIDGKGGNDRICGGAGKDTIHGGPGDDDLYGNGGGDTLYGDAGDDVLVGGPGKDTLNGGADDDVLNGGGGIDGCSGGLGFDAAKRCESVALVP